jgi:hypothetical protein
VVRQLLSHWIDLSRFKRLTPLPLPPPSRRRRKPVVIEDVETE